LKRTVGDDEEKRGARAWPPVAAFEEEQLPHPERQQCEHRQVFIQPRGGNEGRAAQRGR